MGGGMINYALDLAQGESIMGHEVTLLVPGHFTHFHKNKTKIIKKRWNKKEFYSIVNPLPVTCGKGISEPLKLIQEGNAHVYTVFLEKIRPEIIHVHSFMGIHLTFLEEATRLKIPVVYTTHDYYGICPKAILLKNTLLCTMSDGSQCFNCIEKTINIKKLKWHQSLLYEILKNNRFINYLEYSQNLVPIKICIKSLLKKKEKLKGTSENHIQNIQEKYNYSNIQNYYKKMFTHITAFHYNSNQSKQIFTQYLNDITGKVIPISNRTVSDRRKIREFGETLRIGFIGRETYKGFGLLKDALNDLYANGLQDFECHIYFNPKTKLPPYITSHAPYNEKTVDQIFSSMDILVLPSLWKETYGLVVLEALSRGIPVIVSQNVGAKELLVNHKGIGIIIEATKKALTEALENIYQNRDLLRQMNFKICNCNLELDYEKHVQKIVSMYQSISSIN